MSVSIADAMADSHLAIDRLISILKKKDDNALRSFLSSEKGFRSEQFVPDVTLFHYVAGREYETTKEANEWLSYVLEQPNQHIEKPSESVQMSRMPLVRMQLGLRPLHCACEWGNIFGVEWLVNHGARVNAQDEDERGPCSYASASSVHTMKKLLYLEEHGSILWQYDIVWAASNQFSSSEKADEIFHYLVNEKGLSVNAVDKARNTPLHRACSAGSFYGVKWLVEHGAAIDSINRFVKTSFALACSSSVDRLLKVRYLAEKGADLGAEKGKTALFYVTDSHDPMCKDVLQYLVRIKGIDINSVDENGMTPLLYACSENPIFVVLQQLIQLGADVSARDRKKRNALHYGVQNTSDMSIIELFIDEGVDVTCKDQGGNAPLHYACLYGSSSAVQFLVEHKAAINIANRLGITPFMYACRSSIDRSLKVGFLDEKGADCQAKDHEGMTALFFATSPSESEEDVKNVLHHLVIEKCINVNSVEKKKKTSLLYACSHHRPSFVVVQQLIDLGADVSVTNMTKQNALHLAAKAFFIDKATIELLIEKGVDVTFQDKDGKTPHQVARDGEIRALLRQHYDDARFSVLHREMVRPDSIKLCVIGPEMAGKTTLLNSLLQLDRPPPKDKDRTPGVEIHNCIIPLVGKASAWDFGAQPTFHSAHGLFFQESNTMFILVLPIRKEDDLEETLQKNGQFWCAFAKASLRALPKSPIPLMMIFNLIRTKEVTGIEASSPSKRVARDLQELFGNTFKIELSHVIEMDCSKRSSVRMDDCRKKLKKIRENVLEAAKGVPKLCHEIEKHLSVSDEKRDYQLAYFLTTDDFQKWIAEVVHIVLSEDEKKVAVEYLDSSGLIINLGRRICVRPPWLCQNVIGPLLAPSWFPVSLRKDKLGKASRLQINSALTAFEDDLIQKSCPSPFVVTVDDAIEILCYLDLCVELEETPGEYQIPALLDDSIPSDAWVEDPTLDVYRGQRYECAEPVDIISPSSFVIFQCRSFRLTDTGQELWKNGIKLVKLAEKNVIECLVQLGIKKERHCIDIILRWSSKVDCEAAAKNFFSELKLMIVQACDERSPGVILNWFYLDSSHLRQFNDHPAVYSSSEVDYKVNEKTLDAVIFSTWPKRRHYSSVRDLVIIASSFTSDSFPSNEDLVSEELVRACAAVDGANWELMSIAFGISLDDQFDIEKSSGNINSRRWRVLELWMKRKKSPTVRQLLDCLRYANVGQCAVETQYKKMFGRKESK